MIISLNSFKRLEFWTIQNSNGTGSCILFFVSHTMVQEPAEPRSGFNQPTGCETTKPLA